MRVVRSGSEHPCECKATVCSRCLRPQREPEDVLQERNTLQQSNDVALSELNTQSLLMSKMSVWPLHFADQRLYRCSNADCAKAFRNVRDRNAHEVAHSGTVCRRMFTNASICVDVEQRISITFRERWSPSLFCIALLTCTTCTGELEQHEAS